MSNFPESVSLVLSGGGAKGIAHLALLDALLERGIKINEISGTSAGALIGALVASEMPPREILAYLKEIPLFRWSRLTAMKPGIFDTGKFVRFLTNYLPDSFEELSIPLHVCAVDILNGKAVYFNKGELSRTVLASCAIPMVFAPLKYKGTYFIDGGIMDNFPLKPLEGSTDYILGSYVSGYSTVDYNMVNSMVKVMSRSNVLMIFEANKHKFLKTNASVIFPLDHFRVFDTNKLDDIYAFAKNYVSKAMDEIIAAPSHPFIYGNHYPE